MKADRSGRGSVGRVVEESLQDLDVVKANRRVMEVREEASGEALSDRELANEIYPGRDFDNWLSNGLFRDILWTMEKYRLGRYSSAIEGVEAMVFLTKLDDVEAIKEGVGRLAFLPKDWYEMEDVRDLLGWEFERLVKFLNYEDEKLKENTLHFVRAFGKLYDLPEEVLSKVEEMKYADASIRVKFGAELLLCQGKKG